jgi:hypothetical protein
MQLKLSEGSIPDTLSSGVGHDTLRCGGVRLERTVPLGERTWGTLASANLSSQYAYVNRGTEKLAFSNS